MNLVGSNQSMEIASSILFNCHIALNTLEIDGTISPRRDKWLRNANFLIRTKRKIVSKPRFAARASMECVRDRVYFYREIVKCAWSILFSYNRRTQNGSRNDNFRDNCWTNKIPFYSFLCRNRMWLEVCACVCMHCVCEKRKKIYLALALYTYTYQQCNY